MDHVKIQINSLEALERLIGGNSQLEFEIRQNVAEAFAKKHLKSMLSVDVLQTIASQLKQTLNQDLFSLVKTKTGYFSKYDAVLTDQVKDLLKQELEVKKEEIINSFVQDNLKIDEMRKKMDDTFEKRVNFIVNSLSEYILTKKLDMMVDEKIKERLNLK